MSICPNCGLSIGQGNMSTTLPLCQCAWNKQPFTYPTDQSEIATLKSELSASDEARKKLECELECQLRDRNKFGELMAIQNSWVKKLQRENESLQAELSASEEARKVIEQNAQDEINRLNAQILDRDTKIESLQAERVRMVEACNSAKDAFVTQVGSDYNDIVHSAYLKCRNAISNSSEHTERFMAEVRMKAYADVLADAIDICQDQQGNEENDDFAQGYEAGCKECEEGIKHLANELREAK